MNSYIRYWQYKAGYQQRERMYCKCCGEEHITDECNYCKSNSKLCSNDNNFKYDEW